MRFSHRWQSAVTKPTILRPTTHAVCFVAQRAKSVALRSSLKALGGHTVPLINLLQYLCLVGLKDGHSVRSRTCLSRHHVGLTDQSRGGPTRLGRKERVGLPREGRNSARGAQLAYPRPPGLWRTPAPQNQRGW